MKVQDDYGPPRAAVTKFSDNSELDASEYSLRFYDFLRSASENFI